MDSGQVVLLCFIGVVAGVVSGMLGIGGALVVVPALVYLMGYRQMEAQGTSLALLLPPVGILAVYNYYKHGHVNVKAAAILVAAFVLGGWLGSAISLNIPEKVVKKVFAIVILLVGGRMLLG